MDAINLLSILFTSRFFDFFLLFCFPIVQKRTWSTYLSAMQGCMFYISLVSSYPWLYGFWNVLAFFPQVRFLFFLTFYFLLRYSQVTNNVVIVSGKQPKYSAIYTHVSSLPQNSRPPWLPLNIEQSSLCYKVGPFWLPILNIAVCTCPSPNP